MIITKIFHKMNIRNYILLLFIAFLQTINAQKSIKTTVDAKTVINHFSKGEKLTWAMPISGKESLLLRWEERKNTSAVSENLKTFAGYENGTFVATITIGKESVSGYFFRENDEFYLKTIDGFLTLYTQEDKKCGLCDENCSHSHEKASKKPIILSDETSSSPKIANSDVLRVYRLAIPVAYNYFSSIYFNKNIENVKQFWTNIETFLNEVYVRDLGIKFEVLRDERLIMTSAETSIFNAGQSPQYIISFSTEKLNELIGEKNYDLGIWISYHSASASVSGLAYMWNAYTKDKAAAVATMTPSVIAHEIGHLFGGRHTASIGVEDTEKTEVSRGQSIMSVGSPRDFFSLSSIERIRTRLCHTPYYANQERTTLVGSPSANENIPLGIKISSKAPKIETSKLKSNYIIPEGTFFQFYIPANDEDSSDLWYAAHQKDERFARNASISNFLAYKPSKNNPVRFQTTYSKNTGDVETFSTPQATGKFTFWLSVNDAAEGTNKPYTTQYDLFQTQVNIVYGEPFKIMSATKREYKGGDKMELQWNVDKSIFGTDSKVRILLSDDFGQTFKHILTEETENDGKHEIILPNMEIGTMKYAEKTVGMGVIKVEVIDGLAYDLTNYNPKVRGGGFQIKINPNLSEELQFLGDLPQNKTINCDETLPEKAEISVKGGCSPTVSFEESGSKECGNKIVRIWKATDSFGKVLTHTQTIIILPKEEINDNSQENNTEENNDNSSESENNSNSSENNSGQQENNSGQPESNDDTKESNNETKENNNETNESNSGQSESNGDTKESNNETKESETNTGENNTPTNEENPKQNEESSGQSEGELEQKESDTKTIENEIKIEKNKEDISLSKEIIIYNGVSSQNSSENYFRIGNAEGLSKVKLQIFNELGQLVYKSDNYLSAGEAFRGYANVKSVWFPNKKLPSGTYFYILEYKNKNENQTKKGYLFIR